VRTVHIPRRTTQERRRRHPQRQDSTR
jgi:hypothetical protein